MNVEAMAATAAPAPEAGWQRWLVMVAATLGLLVAAYGFTLIWTSPDTALRVRIYHGILLTTAVAMFGISWLIAWRAGHSIANLALALAFTAGFLNDSSSVVLLMLGHVDTPLYAAVNAVTYIAGAGLFIRASQHFPRLVSPALIAASPSWLGKSRPIRAVLTAMLKPAVCWPVVLVLSTIGMLTQMDADENAARLVILAFGIAYFYVNYRAGEADPQRKVLWFLAAVMGVAVMSLVGMIAVALLGEEPTVFRTAVILTLQVLASLSLIVCVAAAVFYAGAVSPVLVIRKTVVYGLTTALLLFVFATVEVFLHHQIVHFLHVTDTLASSLIGGLFGLTFHPVKHYFEGLLARLQGKSHAH